MNFIRQWYGISNDNIIENVQTIMLHTRPCITEFCVLKHKKEFIFGNTSYRFMNQATEVMFRWQKTNNTEKFHNKNIFIHFSNKFGSLFSLHVQITAKNQRLYPQRFDTHWTATENSTMQPIFYYPRVLKWASFFVFEWRFLKKK